MYRNSVTRPAMVILALEGATGSAGRTESTSGYKPPWLWASSFGLSSGPQA